MRGQCKESVHPRAVRHQRQCRAACTVWLQLSPSSAWPTINSSLSEVCDPLCTSACTLACSILIVDVYGIDGIVMWGFMFFFGYFLAGLEHLNVLQTLDVSHNMIGRVSDVSALINMTKLSDLKLEVRSSRACACSVCRVCPCVRMQDLTRVGLFLWFQGNPLASTKGYKLIIVEKYFGSAPPPSILRCASSTEWVCRSPVAHMVCLVAACSV